MCTPGEIIIIIKKKENTSRVIRFIYSTNLGFLTLTSSATLIWEGVVVGRRRLLQNLSLQGCDLDEIHF